MEPQLASRMKEIVAEALALPEAERRAHLETACGGDTALYAEAASLLELDGAAKDFLAVSPVQPPPAEPLEAGDRLGAYRLLEKLGSGGMGDVYLAERADDFEQRVAIKVIRSAHGLGELLQRFVSERQLLAQLKHPHVAGLLDGGTTADGRPYLVMELVDGQPIDAYCASQGLGVEARLRLFLKVCGAVEHAHRHLVVHRDLKPANILVTPDGEPKLLDFGVAKDLGGGGKTPDTRLVVPLTPEYASPEQLTGAAATTAVDVYALGVVLYELLAGERPFGRATDPLAERARPERPSTRAGRAGGPQAKRRRRRLAGDLDHIVLRALEPDPAKRYASVEQLARDLRRHLDGQALETRGGVLYRLGKLARRRWQGLAAAALTLGLAGFWLQESLERRQLERETARVTQLLEALGDYVEDLFIAADPGRSGERSEALERMLDRGVELLSSESQVQEPLMRARLLGAIGQVYRRQSRLGEAEPLLRESLALRRAHLAPDDEWIAVACSNLGILLRDRGEHAEARSLLWEARQILRKHYPGDHPRVAALLNNLAGVEKDLGQHAEAVGHYREALAMKRRLGYEPAEVAMAVKNLGTGLRAAGRLDEAEATFREALAELARADEPNPLIRAGTEHHLGSLLLERGDLAAARELLERAHAARLELYGAGHAKTAETAGELARLDSQSEGTEGTP